MHKISCALCLFLVLISRSSGQTPTECEFPRICLSKAERSVEIDCLNDNFINCTNIGEFLIEAEDAHILATVETVHLTNANKALLVKSGSTRDDNFDGRIFVHFIEKSRSYVSLSKTMFIMLLDAPTVDNDRPLIPNVDEGFRIRVELFDDLITTTTPPPPEDPFPSPPDNETGTYTTYLARRPSDFDETERTNFREYVAELTIIYVKTNLTHLTLKEEITVDNVNISIIRQCPTYWPRSHECTQITFSVPLLLNDTDEYQMTSRNLEKMWRLNNDRDDGYKLYKRGDPEFPKWIAVVCGVILLFTIVLFLIKKMTYWFDKFNTKKKNSDSDDTQNIVAKQVDDQLLMSPHQTIPPMFEAVLQEYDPDKSAGLENSLDHRFID